MIAWLIMEVRIAFAGLNSRRNLLLENLVGPRPLDLALAVLGGLEDPLLLRSAEHCHSMAPLRVPALLALENPMPLGSVHRVTTIGLAARPE